jgi:hypothetical protein
MISAMAAPSFMTVSPPGSAGRFAPADLKQLEQDFTAR